MSKEFIAVLFNSHVKHLQDEGHDVYWFSNGWYHSGMCRACHPEEYDAATNSDYEDWDKERRAWENYAATGDPNISVEECYSAERYAIDTWGGW